MRMSLRRGSSHAVKLWHLGATSIACLMAGSLNPRRALAETPNPSCVVRPEQTEGPYFVDERLNRSDIRSDPTDGRVKPGTPLALTLLVSRLNAGDCQPLPGVQVDIWHCDAVGVYSDVQDPISTPSARNFYVVIRSPMRAARLGSSPCILAGIRGGRYIFTSRFALLPMPAKLRVYVAIVLRR